MKILIIFRGGYTRVSNPQHVCNNVLKYIIAPLKDLNHIINIAFYTYNNDKDKLKIYTDSFNPIKIVFTESGQIINFKTALLDLKNLYKEYDTLIFLRFELIYTMNIIDWNILDKEGIILPFRENSIDMYEKEGLYGDNIIILSNKYFLMITDLIMQHNFTHNIDHLNPLNATLHDLGLIIHKKNPGIPFHCILDGYYQSLSPTNPEVQNPIYIQVHNQLYNENTYKHLIQ